MIVTRLVVVFVFVQVYYRSILDFLPCTTFGRLRQNVWDRRGISQSTKLKVYSAEVPTTLLYVCETWTVYGRHARQLTHFHMSCLRRILGIR